MGTVDNNGRVRVKSLVGLLVGPSVGSSVGLLVGHFKGVGS